VEEKEMSGFDARIKGMIEQAALAEVPLCLYECETKALLAEMVRMEEENARLKADAERLYYIAKHQSVYQPGTLAEHRALAAELEGK
jgi:hypothetical protein